jgi:hypothetical protein
MKAAGHDEQKSTLIGKTMDEVFSFNKEHNQKYFIPLFEKARDKQKTRQAICPVTYFGTDVQIDTRVTPIFNKEGKIEQYLVVMNDQTARINMEIEQKRRQDELSDTIIKKQRF